MVSSMEGDAVEPVRRILIGCASLPNFKSAFVATSLIMLWIDSFDQSSNDGNFSARACRAGSVSGVMNFSAAAESYSVTGA